MLGYTLPALLDQACTDNPNPTALNQWQQGKWRPLSTVDLRLAAEELALGFASLGLQPGDRVGLVMHSDMAFAIADLGSLYAGLVNVPIDLTQTIENILFILQQTGAKALVVSNDDLLEQLLPYFWETPELRWVVMASEMAGEQGSRGAGERQQGGEDGREAGVDLSSPSPSSLSTLPLPPETCLQIPHLLAATEAHRPDATPQMAQCLQQFSLAEVRQRGRQRWSQVAVQDLWQRISPTDLATIIYIASDTKRPHGVMLSHEAMTANAVSAFSSYPHLRTGPAEVALLFLPLTHIFARVFLYGHIAYGHSVYFSDPNHLVKHLRRVQPTILITVPRLLEKVYERILDKGRHLSRFDRAVFNWAVNLTRRFEPERPAQRLLNLQMQLADRLVFGQWRAAFGGRLRACISGGAALSAEVVRFFSAAGVPVLQGYGLTEASGVLCYNRPDQNRPGTVGRPIPAVEVAIAPDQEILIRAPFVMLGYYRQESASQQAIDADVWLHTGDLGSLSDDGFLTITGVKKALFKLSTGKYVSAPPLEQELMASPLVAHAVAVGLNHKFCAMLIFPHWPALQANADAWEIDTYPPDWFRHPRILAHYQRLIDAANCHLPYWSTVRQFALIATELTEASGLLTAGEINRVAVLQRFAGEIGALYGEGRGDAGTQGRGEGEGEGEACPVYARSLTRH